MKTGSLKIKAFMGGSLMTVLAAVIAGVLLCLPHAVRAEEKELVYYIAGTEEYPLVYTENGERQGIYCELINLLAEATGAELKEYLPENGEIPGVQELSELMTEGRINFVLGLSELSELKSAEGVSVSGTVYENSLVAVILNSSAVAAPEDYASCYWGMEGRYIDNLAGTVFESNTVDFSNESELFAALADEAVYGAIVRRSGPDCDMLIKKDFPYRLLANFSFDYRECLYFSGTDPDTAAKILECCSGFAAGKSAEARDYAAEYANRFADQQKAGKIWRILGIAGITGVFVLLILLLSLSGKIKNRRALEEAKLKTLLAADPDKELFELDLKKNKIYAYKNFETFGLKEGELKNPCSLEEMGKCLGYDFISHYEGVRHQGLPIYRNRFVLHTGGGKILIAEEGKRIGKMVLITMTRY